MSEVRDIAANLAKLVSRPVVGMLKAKRREFFDWFDDHVGVSGVVAKELAIPAYRREAALADHDEQRARGGMGHERRPAWAKTTVLKAYMITPTNNAGAPVVTKRMSMPKQQRLEAAAQQLASRKSSRPLMMLPALGGRGRSFGGRCGSGNLDWKRLQILKCDLSVRDTNDLERGIKGRLRLAMPKLRHHGPANADFDGKGRVGRVGS